MQHSSNLQNIVRVEIYYYLEIIIHLLKCKELSLIHNMVRIFIWIDHVGVVFRS